MHKLSLLSSHSGRGKDSVSPGMWLSHPLSTLNQLPCFKCSARKYEQASATRLYNLILISPKVRSYCQDTLEGTRLS